jgi:hypothetical protein
MIDTKDKYVKVGLIAGGIYLGYKLISWIIGSVSTVAQAQNEVKKLVAAGVKPTYPDSTYTQYANAIYSAGFNTLGTDERTIYDIFSKMMNDLDVAKLIAAFGEQRVEFSFQSLPLGAWLRTELSASEMATINKILTDKKIKYQL